MIPALVLIPLALATAAPDAVTLRFAPPDSLHGTQSLTITRVTRIEGSGERHLRTTSTSDILFARSGEGYDVTVTVRATETTRDGATVPDPVSAAMVGRPIVYVLDADGVMRDAEGFGGFAEAVASRATPEVMQVLGPMLREEALVARETAEWNARIGEFVGAIVAPGDSVVTESPEVVPTGDTLRYAIVTHIAADDSCPPGACLRIDSRYDSDASALVANVARTTGDAVQRFGGPRVDAAQAPAHLRGGSSRLLDPRTMLVYRESQWRTLEMSVRVAQGDPVRTVSEERRDYVFHYDR